MTGQSKTGWIKCTKDCPGGMKQIGYNVYFEKMNMTKGLAKTLVGSLVCGTRLTARNFVGKQQVDKT